MNNRLNWNNNDTTPATSKPPDGNFPIFTGNVTVPTELQPFFVRDLAMLLDICPALCQSVGVTSDNTSGRLVWCPSKALIISALQIQDCTLSSSVAIAADHVGVFAVNGAVVISSRAR